MAKGKKTGGRVKGTPNKATADVREFCRGIVGDEVYCRGLLKRARAGKLPPPVECMLWHYAVGKPTESVELSGKDGEAIRVVFGGRHKPQEGK